MLTLHSNKLLTVWVYALLKNKLMKQLMINGSFKVLKLMVKVILFTVILQLMFANQHGISHHSPLENQLVRRVINHSNGLTHGTLKMLPLLENGATSELIFQNLSQEVLS